MQPAVGVETRQVITSEHSIDDVNERAARLVLFSGIAALDCGKESGRVLIGEHAQRTTHGQAECCTSSKCDLQSIGKALERVMWQHYGARKRDVIVGWINGMYGLAATQSRCSCQR